MPLELREQLDELREWEIKNYNAGRKDTIAFWSLKTPAIIAASSAGVFAHFKLTLVSLFVGAIASICVIIDGVNPRGMLRNIHMRAVHDISNLIRRMTSQWRARSPEANVDRIARRIVKASQDPCDVIAKYIRDAETALKDSNH